MAEVKRRSFDLNSPTGLTDLLQAARKSTLDPTAYAQFRDLVLQHAQLKGSDPELKKKIEQIASSLVLRTEVSEGGQSQASPAPAPQEETSSTPMKQSSHGRRSLPTFAAAKPVPQAAMKIVEPVPKSKPPEVAPVVVPEEKPAEPPHTEEVPQTPEAIEQPKEAEIAAPLKSVEEYKARILDIKRRVNSLVGNPATLMDHGNTLGRDYMSALLGALKATSPGSIQNVDEAMADLEAAFENILHRDEHDAGEPVSALAPAEPEESVPEIPEEELAVSEDTPPPAPQEAETTQEDAVPTIPEVSLADFSPQPLPAEVSEVPAEKEPVVFPSVSEEDAAEEIPEVTAPVPSEEVSGYEATLPQEESATSTAKETIAALRAKLAEQDEKIAAVPEAPQEEIAASAATETITALRAKLAEQDEKIASVSDTPPSSRPSQRTLPSILDMAEAEIPSREEVRVPEPAYRPVMGRSDMRALTERPSLGKTVAPVSQAELFSPQVTDILKHILHDWNIFASSGLFGMGPSGIEHPLYEKISALPMGEVLSGRFENANMKIVHVIKDYVDAWRHEQGIAYNPTETFEHYLRRVAERILRRQNPAEKV